MDRGQAVRTGVLEQFVFKYTPKSTERPEQLSARCGQLLCKYRFSDQVILSDHAAPEGGFQNRLRGDGNGEGSAEL